MTVQGIAALIQLVRQQIDTEGLRPVAKRTGIPLGQLRSFVQGRGSRHITLQSIASAMGMHLSIAQVEQRGMVAPLPRSLTKALGLPPDANVADAINAIDRDAAGSRLRRAIHCQRALGSGSILGGRTTTTCRGCMSGHRQQEPVWTSVRGAGVRAGSPAKRGRSEAKRLDAGEHTRTLFV